MENYEQVLNTELAHYNEILEVIHSQLEDAKKDNSKSIEDLRETNRDMWENASHSADNFDGAVQLSQFYQPLASNTFAIESSTKTIQLLERLSQSAYFARIDFCMEAEEQYEKVYIGRGTLFNDQEKGIIIYDWRSPIASLFYRFETGNAHYDAPGGRITGDIGLKRQYEIKKGVFEYFFDADVQIADEFLRKMLSGNTSSKMKSIVETIQKDQDIAIRDGTHDLLMVQGIAGSGKTSIALHRVAYLKYQGLSSRLKSSDIIILSPNTLFEEYISNVLPELGEDEVKSIVFDDLITDSLPDKPAFQSRYHQTEMLISCASSSAKALQKQAMEFKMSKAFGRILNRYADSLPTSHIVFPDIEYDGKTVFTGQYLKNRVLQMNGSSLAIKLSHLRQHIFNEIHEMRKGRMPKLLRQAREDPEHPFDWEEYARELSIKESTLLAQKVDEFIKLNPVSLYKKLINSDNLLLSLSAETELPNNIEKILSYSKEQLTDSTLQNEDALAVTYLQLLIGTNDTYRNIRQVVVDEAQDYYDLHFEILKQLFPNARYTILGDINQTIEKQETMSLYERITNILQPNSSCLMAMNKSFRCTKEILSFSMQFLDDATLFESFNRSGDIPQVIKADSIDLLDGKIIEEAVYSKNQGYQSIGIICKDAQESESLYRRLKDRLSLHLVHSGEDLNTAGVFIIPITMSKGLEFDSVLIYGANKESYHSVDDKKLLYIASTRALHRLNLFYTGEKSAFIQGGIEI
ncbi:HelD family protein [Sinanaerobacter sp. ZZT-01]|uniref:HelD family protein n=1 Tax=Sinanaerobacter sp. ZZT-01 TaxID=3111540 RepID=UPI002D7770B8|nr:UvrD-helicase domain-containing protein [Sinanaerobacter sp. ZZT-01]WRR93800.1 UvrD-helicase domain-containing protein [Sinanaerobacter sp. ZZT-01]